MHKRNSFSLSLNTDAVSPVIGSILMLVVVFLMMSIASTVILSQFETAPDPPRAQVDFEQTSQDKIEQTSRVTIKGLELYNSNTVSIRPQNDSIDLHDESSGAYFEYRDDTTGNLVSPNDPGYNPSEAVITETGEELRINNASDKSVFLVVAENDYGTQVVTQYTVRYYSDI